MTSIDRNVTFMYLMTSIDRNGTFFVTQGS